MNNFLKWLQSGLARLIKIHVRPQTTFMDSKNTLAVDSHKHSMKKYSLECIKIARVLVPEFVNEYLKEPYESFRINQAEQLLKKIMDEVHIAYCEKFPGIKWNTIHGKAWDKAEAPIYHYIMTYTIYPKKWQPLVDKQHNRTREQQQFSKNKKQ